MSTAYPNAKISEHEAGQIAEGLYGMEGSIQALPGEIDFNFRIETEGKSYLLKVGRPGANLDYLEFQQAILQHVAKSDCGIISPVPVPDLQGSYISITRDAEGNKRYVRLLTWVEGRLWSGVNPLGEKQLYSLGEEAGRLTGALKGFQHPLTVRDFEWDLAQAAWTREYLTLHSPEQQEILLYFMDQYDAVQEQYGKLPRSVVHNDANDNNVVLTEDLKDPRVRAIIDYGDAIHTQVINDLAITIAYGVMDFPNPCLLYTSDAADDASSV